MAIFVLSCGNPAANTAYKLALPSNSISCEYRFRPGQECAHPLPGVAALCITEKFFELRFVERFRIGAWAWGSLLIDACCERRAPRQPSGGGHDLFVNFVGRQNTGEQALCLRFFGPEDTPFEQNLQSDGSPRQCQQASHFVWSHGKAQTVYGHSIAGIVGRNAKITLAGYLEPTTHTDSLNFRQHGMHAVGNGLQGWCENAGVIVDDPVEVGPILRELAYVCPGREVVTLPSHYHAA